MSSRTSVFVFGVYLTVMGSLLLLIPNLVLPLFGFDVVDDVWIRVLGLVFVLISSIYYLAVKESFSIFYKLTVYIRLVVFCSFIVFYALNLAPWQLLLFGVFDAVTALWTALLIKSESTVVCHA